MCTRDRSCAPARVPASQVSVLEFEFIMRGFWRPERGVDQRRLRPVLDSLEARGYRCFWQGESGRLAAASGPYWCDSFQFKTRSNLVCSHRPDVLKVLCGLAGLKASSNEGWLCAVATSGSRAMADRATLKLLRGATAAWRRRERSRDVRATQTNDAAG